MSALRIGIVDYDAGNLKSVAHALETLNYRAVISDQHSQLSNCPFLILPGVGAFASAMNSLRQKNLIPLLEDLVLGQQKPILGICVGMQILAESSTEGGLHQGLAWLKGAHVDLMRVPDHTPLPHVGWNEIEYREAPMMQRTTQGECFYFDHSYVMHCPESMQIAHVEYGGRTHCAAVQSANIMGVQFHPEKSHRAGLRLLRSAIRTYEDVHA